MSEAKKQPSRNVYMDVVRIIGCMMVILVHISAIDWNTYAVTSLRWQVLNVINSVGMSGVPLFFMVSGALFMRESSNLSIKYVWKKILMLGLLYFGALLFYNTVPFVTGRVLWNVASLKVNFVDNVLLGGGIYHLWFLPMLMVMYALSPILKSAFASKRNCEYFLVLFVIFGTLIPLLARYEGKAQVHIESVQYRFSIFWLTGQLGYFILGHYLHSFAPKLSKGRQILAGVIAVVTMGGIIIINALDAVRKAAPSSNVSTPLSITCFLFVGSLFWTLRSGMDVVTSENMVKVLGYLSSLTLGIYFIHPFLIEYVLKYFRLESLLPNYLILTVVRVLLLALVSGGIVAILKKIPLLKKIF